MLIYIYIHYIKCYIYIYICIYICNICTIKMVVDMNINIRSDGGFGKCKTMGLWIQKRTIFGTLEQRGFICCCTVGRRSKIAILLCILHHLREMPICRIPRASTPRTPRLNEASIV